MPRFRAVFHRHDIRCANHIAWTRNDIMFQKCKACEYNVFLNSQRSFTFNNHSFLQCVADSISRYWSQQVIYDCMHAVSIQTSPMTAEPTEINNILGVASGFQSCQ